MEKTTLVCPFTGIQFEALKLSNGDMIARNPVTLENVYICKTDNGLSIPSNAFDMPETVILSQAAKMLHVSRQRVSALVANGTLRAFDLPGNSKAVILEDVEAYARTRRNGRPQKCEE